MSVKVRVGVCEFGSGGGGVELVVRVRVSEHILRLCGSEVCD